MRKTKLTPELSNMKENLKKIAQDIRSCKEFRRNFQKGKEVTKSIEINDLMGNEEKFFNGKINKLSNHYRHMHIAYCELRGTSRGKIEQNVPRAKELSENVIKTLKALFTDVE